MITWGVRGIWLLWGVEYKVDYGISYCFVLISHREKLSLPISVVLFSFSFGFLGARAVFCGFPYFSSFTLLPWREVLPRCTHVQNIDFLFLNLLPLFFSWTQWTAIWVLFCIHNTHASMVSLRAWYQI